MVTVGVLIAFAVLMSLVPGKEDLAKEVLSAAARDKNKECCADVKDDSVCVLPMNHKGDHLYESIDSIIPIN